MSTFHMLKLVHSNDFSFYAFHRAFLHIPHSQGRLHEKNRSNEHNKETYQETHIFAPSVPCPRMNCHGSHLLILAKTRLKERNDVSPVLG